MAINWQKLDRLELEKKYKVKDTAEADAKFDIPASDQSRPTACEIDIIGDGESCLFNNKDIGNHNFGKMEKKIIYEKRMLESQSHATTLNTILKILRNFKTTKLNKIFRKKEARTEAEQEMLRFRKSHRLTRDADHCTLNKLFLYLLLAGLFFFGEVMLNGKLVGSILPGGENEGKLLALGVAAINVIVAFLIGFYGLKNINDEEYKVVFSVVVSMLMLGIFYINWSYGAFRAVAEIEGQKMLGDSIDFDPTLIGILLQQALRPWDVAFTFQGLLLLAIGIFVAGISLLEGYYIDDKFPGYGKKTRKLNEIVSQHQEANTQFYDDFTNKKIEQRDLLHRVTTELNSRLTNLDDTINDFQEEFERYTEVCVENEKVVNHVLNHYRDENDSFRTSKAPEYFKKKFSYDDDDRDPFIIFKAFKKQHMEDTPREAQTKKYQQNIDLAASEAHKQLEIEMRVLESEIDGLLKES